LQQDDLENDTIRALYAAATGQCDWTVPFDRLLDATGFCGAAFYCIDRSTRTTLDQRWHRLDPSYADTYLQDYIPLDPRAAQVFVPNPQRVLYDYLHTEEAAIDRDPFYAWFQPSQGMRYYVGGQSFADENMAVTLTLHRPRQYGHAEPAELEKFSRLFDHFEHAVRLQRRLALDARQEAEAQAERDRSGMVLLGTDLSVLYANAAARRVAERGDALRLAAGRLGADSPADDSALRVMLAAAGRHQVTRPLSIARRFGGLPYICTAYPVTGGDLLARRVAVAVAVRILDPDAEDHRGISEAAAMLGLSHQETQVASRLAAGADPVEIGAELGLKPATVRTYLAAIYRKTGVRRQGELVSRLARLAEFLGGT
jgi:DNA-binding CsgD family transcriptional regulator